MFSYLKIKLHTYFNSGHKRSLLIKKNIFYAFLLKGGSVIITFLLVPLTINYINAVQYGIWLTISSMVYWVNIFDIGIGNGLKNEIAYSQAIKDDQNVKIFVSTSYAILAIIAGIIFISFLLVTSFLNWNSILNVSTIIKYNINPVILVTVTFFCVQFVLQLLDALLSATQQVFKSSLILFIGQLIGLISIYILTHFVKGSLVLLVTMLAGSSVVSLFFASILLYNSTLKKFAPSLKYVDFKLARKLLNVGGIFFFIQIGAMILIYSNNFIITRILGPKAVTIYNIPFKLFSFISMLFIIIIMPYWSAFTEAHALKDFSWIKTNIKKLRKIWLYLFLLGIVILIFSNYIYKFWINNVIKVPFSLSACMLLYITIYTWQTLHVYFLNGVGKIRLQLFVVIIGAIINIPLAIYLGELFGIQGIISANMIIFLIMGIIFTFQCEKIINGTATKLWNK